jgi:hypothetical protein
MPTLKIYEIYGMLGRKGKEEEERGVEGKVYGMY